MDADSMSRCNLPPCIQRLNLLQGLPVFQPSIAAKEDIQIAAELQNKARRYTDLMLSIVNSDLINKLCKVHKCQTNAIFSQVIRLMWSNSKPPIHGIKQPTKSGASSTTAERPL